MKTDSEKLEFLLRAIVTAGGPEQGDMADEVYLLRLSGWLLNKLGEGAITMSTSRKDAYNKSKLCPSCGSDHSHVRVKP